MKVALVSGFFPDENIRDILNNSKGIVQHAAHTLQKAIIDGLINNKFSFEIINLPFVGSYPRRYKKIFTPNNRFKIVSKINTNQYIKGKNYRFFNLSLIRYRSRQYITQKALSRWAKYNHEEEKIIIIYSMSYSALKAACSIKKKYNSTKIICIVPDLPLFTSAGGSSYIRKWYKDRNTNKLEQLYHCIDGYVLLTESMAKQLKIINTPYEIIEGIYNPQDEVKHFLHTSEKTRNIVYAGTLAKKYGVLNLVKAFIRIKNYDIKLIICGEGDAKSEIEEYAKIDNRIILTGNTPRTEVLKILQEATVLVNPRTPEGEYTNYSFPSKTMEFLASGVPTILYKLPGIPNEYYNYCISLSDISIEHLSETITKILEMPRENRINLGLNARQFILNYKNPKVQTEKIIRLINRICQSSKIKPS